MKFKKTISALIAASQLCVFAPLSSLAEDQTQTRETGSNSAFSELSFTNEGIQDTSDYAKKWDVQPLSYGDTPISYNEDLNLYEATFNNKENFYKLILNDELREKMTNGYSIQAYFNPASTEKTMNVIGAAQSQGFDFEVLSGGHFDACLNHGSGWIKVDGKTPGYNASISADNYYLMTVTYDGSEVKVYQNDKLIQTINSSGKLIFPTEHQQDAKGDPYYGMVIGGDYNPTRYNAGGTETGYAIEQMTGSNTAFNGKIAYVGLYKGALTEAEISEAYDSINARGSMEVLDELNSILTETLPLKQEGFEDDKELKALIDEGWELMGKIGVTENEILEYIEKAKNYDPVSPSYDDGVKMRVGVLSDYQYGRNSKDSEKFKSALTQILEKAGGQENLDALLLVGDISHNSYNSEYETFLKDIEEVLPRETRHPKIIAIRGNHDAKENAGGDSSIRDRRDNFLNRLREYDPSILTTNGITEINGYQFVYVSQDNQKGSDAPSNRTYLHSPETVKTFEADMQKAASKSEGKPIFVVMHPNATDTVYGSYVIDGTVEGKSKQSDYWGTKELLNGLNPYPNAITFSGHSHWTISHPRSVHKGNFYSLNTGAVNNMEIETSLDEKFQPKRYGTNNENESSGYYFEVKTDETVEIHKMDFNRNSEFGEPIVIDVNSEDNGGYDYTDNRDKENPAFDSNAKVTVSDITINDCKVSFPQASDDIGVTSYTVEYENQTTGATEKTVTVSSYYWLKGTEQEVKENYFTLSEFNSINGSSYYKLQDNTPYKVKVSAVDAYGKKSAHIESEVFTTKQKEVIPVDKSVVASAYFTNDKLMDYSEFAVNNDLTQNTNGNNEYNKISYNSELKRYEANIDPAMDNKAGGYGVLLNDDRKKLLQTEDGYTIETYFKADSIIGRTNTVIGAAQTGGFDIEYTKEGKLQVFVRNSSGWIQENGKYPGENIKIEPGKYYHLAVSVTPSSVKVYCDGQLVDSLNTGGILSYPTNSNMKPHYGMYMGCDYRPENTNSQSPMDGNIVFAKLYSRALTDSEVLKEFNDIEARKNLTEADELNTMLTETLPSKISEYSTDAKLKEFLIEGWLLMGKTSLIVEEITAFIDKVNAYEPIKPVDDGINLRFAVLSDYQYGRGLPSGFTLPSGFSSYLDYTGYKVRTAIKEVIEKSKDENGIVRLDAIMIPGDMTHNGKPAEYQKLVSDLDSIPEIKDGTVKLMFLRGNHDCNQDDGTLYKQYLGKYGVTDTNQVYDIKGYKFIMMSQDTGGYSDLHNPEGVTYLHEESTIKWFNEQLQTVAQQEKKSGKPVFVGTHPNPYETVFGSFIVKNPGTGAESKLWSTKDYYGMERTNATQEEKDANFKGMKDYPNIISFSGHSHWALQNPRSMWQGEFTAFNTGSVNNMELENFGMSDGYMPKRYGTNSELESTGYYVTVDKNNVVSVEMLDLYRNKTYGEPYVIDVNDKENWAYTDEKRDVGTPYFDSDAKITVTGLTPYSATVNYPQAKDDHTVVNNYVVKVSEKESGNVVKTVVPSSYYWLIGTDQEVKTNNWSFSDLKPDTEYTVEITAYNSYYRASENVLTGEFRTDKEEIYIPDEHVKTIYDLTPDKAKRSEIDNADNSKVDIDAHGISLDSSKNVTWSTVVISDKFTGNQEAIRFSTKGVNGKGQAGRLMKLDFANDTVLKPETFTDGIYNLDAKIGLVHANSGTINMKLYGKNSSGEEKVLTTLNFNSQKASSNPESAYILDQYGQSTGNILSVPMGTSDANVSKYMNVRFVVDLNSKTFSAYIAPDVSSNEYKLLIKNQPFNNEADILSGVEFNILGTLYTYGLALQQIKVSQDIEPAEFKGTISADTAALVSGSETTVNVNFKNPNKDTHKTSLYIASYDSNGFMIGVKKFDKTVTEETDSMSEKFTAPANTYTVKVFLWKDNMTSIDMMTASK